MMHVLAIAAGGALGSVLRYGMSSAVQALVGRAFPYGTLAVNVTGCLLVGVAFVWFLERADTDAVLRAGLLIGLFGGFTTFSAFSMETLNLLEEGAWLRAGLNVGLTLILCLVAVRLGVLLARQL